MISVAVALGAESWEPALVSELVIPASGVQVVRRCVDAVDLAAVVSGGHVQIAIVGPRLPRLDLATIELCQAAGVPVVGVHARRDDLSATRLRAFGTATVVAINPDDIVLAALHVARAATELQLTRQLPASVDDTVHADPDLVSGRIVAVIGPAGAPGRSTVALNLAATAAQQGSAVLVDADEVAPSQAELVGVMVDTPGVVRVARVISDGMAPPGAVRAASVRATDQLRLLTGAHVDELLRPTVVGRIIAASAQEFDHVIVDTSSWLTPSVEQASIVSTVAAQADVIVVVGHADPVGLVRLFPLLSWLADAAPQAQRVLALNNVRASALGGAERNATEILGGLVAVPPVQLVAHDRRIHDAAVLRAAPAVLTAPPRAVRDLRALAAMTMPSNAVNAEPSAPKRHMRSRSTKTSQQSLLRRVS